MMNAWRSTSMPKWSAVACAAFAAIGSSSVGAQEAGGASSTEQRLETLRRQVNEQSLRLDALHEHLQWEPHRVARVIDRAEGRALVRRDGGHLKLTGPGRAAARDVLNLTG